MDSVVLLGRCLSDPIAVRVLALLLEGPKSAQRIRADLNISRAILDVRLSKLQRARLIEPTGRSRSNFITLATNRTQFLNLMFEEFGEAVQWEEDLVTVGTPVSS